MKLNILTALWRTEFVEKQYEDIPKNKNVNWILCKSDLWNGKIPNYIKNSKDVNVIISTINIPHSFPFDLMLKLNECIKNVENGFFYILDDDNKMHEKIYKIYDEYKQSNYKMIIGKQIRSDGNIKLKANYPCPGGIDMGNVLCSTEIFKKVKDFTGMNKYYGLDIKTTAIDHPFWITCFNNIDIKDVLLLNQICFYHNGLVI
jgi:hypothetical protein